MVFLFQQGDDDMLRIAICDDDNNDLQITKTMTLNLLESLSIDLILEEFKYGSELLKSIISFDLILLDIKMENMNGIDIAKQLRNRNDRAKIIFISNSTDYLQLGYSVHAERYLLKPLDKYEFNYELTSILMDKLIDNKYILDKRIGFTKLYLKDILYIEFHDRKTIVHKNSKEVLSTMISIKEWMYLLNKYKFSQNHKAYIVNLKGIKQIKNSSIILKNNEELPLSRTYKEKLKFSYFNLIEEII